MQNKQQEIRQFVEELALFGEGLGLPPMAGRIWAWLLVCEPPHQSAQELADAVGASLGSISSMTRLLDQLGLIERVGMPGERSRHYRVRAGGFADLLRIKLAATAELRKIAERGLELLRDEPPEARRRLEEYRDFYAFFEKEFPALIRRWEETKKGASQ